MKKYVENIRTSEIMVKTFNEDTYRPDLKQRKYFRRFFFARKNIKKNERISNSNIICLRSQKKNLVGVDQYKKIISKKTRKEIKQLDPIQFKHLK